MIVTDKRLCKPQVVYQHVRESHKENSYVWFALIEFENVPLFIYKNSRTMHKNLDYDN